MTATTTSSAAPASDRRSGSVPTLRSDRVDPRFLELVPRDFAREHLILSQGNNGDERLIAVSQQTDQAAVHNVGVRLGIHPKPFIADDAEQLAKLIDEAYEQHQKNHSAEPAATVNDDFMPDSEEIDHLLSLTDRDLLSLQGKGPIVRLVDGMLFEALSRRASDLHIQPLEDRTLVRYRLDGVLTTVREIPRSAGPAIVSRIKVMGRMDIAERRLPQDGRATVQIAQRSIDLRISTLPTSHGERVVMRLLDNHAQLSSFDQLGMPQDVAAPFLQCAQKANGIILVTGPTGSGKTTTLYATLRRIGSASVNIMTIEDPIEYELSTTGLAISQSQVNARKGVTFATGLRHILRQDPDVVMVGEIRDAETAKIAIQASLTGHLVFSTLHTNDAASAVTRLVDLGVEPYLVSASLSAALAQRLVRRQHRDCNGNGCEGCLGIGFLGRIGLFELLVVTEVLRQAISDRAGVDRIRQLARDNGVRTLVDEGRRLVEQGVTTLSEVTHVVEVIG